MKRINPSNNTEIGLSHISRRIASLLFGSLLVLWMVHSSPVWAITPYDYGAVGDGVADDTSALQSALNRRQILVLASGNFRITGSLLVPANSGMYGPGKIHVDFDSGSTSSSNAAIRCMGDNIQLCDFAIEKDFVDGSYGIGVMADGMRNLRISGLDIFGYSARYGIHIISCESFVVSGCEIHDFMMNTTADMIEDSPAGLRITRSYKGMAFGNRINNIEVGPIGMASISPLRPSYGPQGYQSDLITGMQCEHVSYLGNQIETSGEGIDILYSKDSLLAGNHVANIYFQGVKALAASSVPMVANFFRDAYQGIGLSGGLASILYTPCEQIMGIVGSVIGGREDPASEGDTLAHIQDGNFNNRVLISQQTAQRYSILIDLLADKNLSDLVLVSAGDYRTAGQFPGGLVQIETSLSADGPFTLGGSAQWECARPNPSGAMLKEEAGKSAVQNEARRIALDSPRFCRYARFSASYCLDNAQIISEALANHATTLHRMRPVGNAYQNFPRTPFLMTDGNLETYYNPKITAGTVDLDLGTQPVEFNQIRFARKPNDGSYLPRSGRVWVSSTDHPDHFDTQIQRYDLPAGANMHHQDLIIMLPELVEKRYVRVSWDALQSQFRTETRIAEILIGDQTACSQTPASGLLPARANPIFGNLVLNSGSEGSFGIPGIQRVRYSMPYGIDLHDNPEYNLVGNNLLIDAQPTKTMTDGISQGGIGNLVEDNLTVYEIVETPLPTPTLMPTPTPTEAPQEVHTWKDY